MKPILFNTAMVRAILDGRKTVTRRAVKFKCGGNPNWTGYVPDGGVLYGSNNIPAAKAQYKPGDILYVRETWCDPSEMGYHPILYKADFPMHYDAEQTEFGEPIDLLAEDSSPGVRYLIIWRSINSFAVPAKPLIRSGKE